MSVSPLTKAAMAASFSFGFILPWTQPTVSSGKVFFKVSACSVADLILSSASSLSSTMGQTTNTCLPSPTWARMKPLSRSRYSSVTETVSTLCRPGGSSSRMDTSRSP